jgi:hypothetical protein
VKEGQLLKTRRVKKEHRDYQRSDCSNVSPMKELRFCDTFYM